MMKMTKYCILCTTCKMIFLDGENDNKILHCLHCKMRFFDCENDNKILHIVFFFTMKLNA